MTFSLKVICLTNASTLKKVINTELIFWITVYGIFLLVGTFIAIQAAKNKHPAADIMYVLMVFLSSWALNNVSMAWNCQPENIEHPVSGMLLLASIALYVAVYFIPHTYYGKHRLPKPENPAEMH